MSSAAESAGRMGGAPLQPDSRAGAADRKAKTLALQRVFRGLAHGRFRGMLYGLLAVWSTWPLVRFATSGLPLGVESFATVPLFNAWTIWWNADRLVHGFADYWHAPIFFPIRGAFAFSEAQPALLVVAPVYWASGSLALAYNVYLVGSLVLNAVFAERLLRRTGCGPLACLCGGAGILLLPFVHWQREVLQLAPLWPTLWTWDALLRMSRRPRWRTGAEIGVAFGMTCLASLHQGLLLALVLAFVAVLLAAAPNAGSAWRDPRLWLRSLPGIAIAGLCALPMAWEVQSARKEHGFERRRETIEQLSAQPGDYVLAPGRPLVPLNLPGARPGWPLSPGAIRLLLIPVGIWWGLRRRARRRSTQLLLLLAAVSWLLSLGPNLVLFGWRPWWLLAEAVPGLALVRNVFRFGVFFQAAGLLLAVGVIHQFEVLSRCRSLRLVVRHGWGVAAAACGLLLAFETPPAPMSFANVPPIQANRGWAEFVRKEVSSDDGILCVPLAPGDEADDFEMTTRWMYLQSLHGARMVNGYSGFFPAEDFALREQWNAGRDLDGLLGRLAAVRVKLVVVDATQFDPAWLEEAPLTAAMLELAWRDDELGVRVYRLRPSTN